MLGKFALEALAKASAVIPSTSSVDKSVHKELFTSFLSYPAATDEQIAYFLGIDVVAFRLLYMVVTIFSADRVYN
jgi:hypothetical protein